MKRIRIRTWCLGLVLVGALVVSTGLALAGPGDQSFGRGPVRQAGVVISTVQDDPSASPTPAVPGSGFAVATDEEPAELPADPAYPSSSEESPFIEEEGPEGGWIAGSCSSCAGGACRLARGGRCGRGSCGAYCPGEPVPLIYSAGLDARGIHIGGWVDQGLSVVANSPADRFTGVVTFNDRDGEYQMNQLWTYLEKAIDPNRFFDVGGRVDFVYGTDARFTQAVDGLEANWDQEERFYQAALPQFYLDASLADWTLRIGHFFTPIGYEVVGAPGNFFYSHAYTRQYGEPFTHTGFLLMHEVGSISLSAGLQRGNDQFDDTDGLDALGYLGSVSWTNQSGDITTAFAVSATEDGPGVETLIYSLLGIFDLSERFTWVLQHDYGRSTIGRGGTRAQWYGVNQYFLYEINCCLSAGVRWEWFYDEDGTRVRGLGDGNLATGPFIGDFYELTLGLNWRPHGNILVRPEVRWDRFDQDGPGAVQPYDAGESDDQFMFACDLILLF